MCWSGWGGWGVFNCELTWREGGGVSIINWTERGRVIHHWVCEMKVAYL